jgi:hypothetical protein
MGFSIKRWGVGSLVGTWAGYWVALGAVTLAPFTKWIWELNRIPGEHGTASASLDNSILTLTALKDGVTVYSGSASLTQIALWVAGPPLLLWLAWLLLRPSRSPDEELHAPPSYDALPDAARSGWAQPLTPSSTLSPVERRERGDR